MSKIDSVTYPFRLASWKTAKALENSKNLFTIATFSAIVTSASFVGFMNESPDSTAIEGQEERITSYQEQFSFLKNIQERELNPIRESWRSALPNEKEKLIKQVDATQNRFNNQSFRVLSSLYTEDKISEKEIGGLLEFFEKDIANIESIKSKDKFFGDIGDAAHLNECQIKYATDSSELNRSLEISSCTTKHEKAENTALAVVPLTGLAGFLFYILADMLLIQDNKSLRRYAQKPAPKKQKNIGNH